MQLSERSKANETDERAPWEHRSRQFQEREWELIQRLFDAAERMLTQLVEAEPTKLTLADAAKALETASKLGRVAANLSGENLPSDPGDMNRETNAEFDETLNRIYGEPLEPFARQWDNLGSEANPKPGSNPRPADGGPPAPRPAETAFDRTTTDRPSSHE